MPKFRKKPVVIEAIQWIGSNQEEIMRFAGSQAYFEVGTPEAGLYIKTLEGDHFATTFDFIIKGVHGEFYPCKADIFWKTYEGVPDA